MSFRIPKKRKPEDEGAGGTIPPKQNYSSSSSYASASSSSRQTSNGGKNASVYMNGFELQIGRSVEIHKYEIKLFGVFRKRNGDEDRKDLTQGSKEAKDDISIQKRRRGCWEIFRAVVRENNSLFGDRNHRFVYDCGLIFYSIDAIFPETETKTGTFDVAILSRECQDYYGQAMKMIEYSIKKVRDGTFTLGVAPEDKDDRSMQQFLEVLTSQGVYAEGLDNLIFRNHRYDVKYDTPVLRNKPEYPFCVRHGSSKSVFVAEIENSNKALQTILQLEKKTSPFFPRMNVLQFVDQSKSDIGERIVRGLFVTTTHLKKQKVFRVADFSKMNCNDITFKMRDRQNEDEFREISVTEYYQEAHKFSTRAGHRPCVVERKKRFNGEKEENNYPMDCLEIMDGQRIMDKKQSGDITAYLISEARVLPRQMGDEIKEELNHRVLNQEAEKYLEAFGVRISRDLLRSDAKILQAPKIAYGDKEKYLTTDNGQKNAWKIDDALKFYRPGKISDAGGENEQNRWIFAVLNEFQSERDHAAAKRFLGKLQDRAKLRGMLMLNPEVRCLDVRDPDPDTVNKKLSELCQYAKANKVKFIMFIQYERKDMSRDTMKQLETKFKLTTQQITMSTVNKGAGDKGDRMVLDNILNKTNEKLGGINCIMKPSPQIAQWFSGNVMYMGLDISHPGLGGNALSSVTPTAVGMTFTKNRDEVQGRYWFQEAREHMLRSLKKQIVFAIEEFNRCSRRYPDKIVVYRGGVSEGEYDKVKTDEVEQFMEAFREINFPGKRKPALIIVIVQRNSGYRLIPTQDNDFRGNDAIVQNVLPGTCAEVIGEGGRKEFILVPHQAIQGTAKPSKYVLIYDEAKCITLSELETLTNTLCYSHGIVTSPVSCPSILYQAGDLAKRAINNYRIHSSRRDFGAMPPIEEVDKRNEYFDQMCDMLQVTLDTRFWA
ncbi:hypothetical protein L596_028038 [Steinernema carpocapsae]|uniref:Piwi domain-containing protein n=1 Tax=Steinernema carpocapsae TaxID=34508 RepID=A0A4U5LXD9_STECR|nr:hypothetical protein L596_028038 [Steinernema carpocapsae]